MSNDMKLIMESWRSNVLREEIDDCGEATVGDVMRYYEIITGAKSKKDAKDKMIDAGLELTGWMTSLLGLIGEPDAFMLSIGAGAGPYGAIAGIVGAAITVAVRSKRTTSKQRVDNILKSLCIDPKLIDILDDDIEEEFINDRSFKKLLVQVAKDAELDPNAPIPNFNAELIGYIEQVYLDKSKPSKQTTVKDISRKN